MDHVRMDTVVERNRALLDSDMGDEKVMLHLDRGVYYGLNEVGARIYDLCDTPVSVRGICDSLVEQFEVDREACETSVERFVRRLLSNDVIRAVDG